MLLQIHKYHLYPVIALAFLTFGIMILMGRRRFAAIRKGEIPVGYFKDYQQREPFLLPAHVQVAARNYMNLFEFPVLFYAIIPLLILSAHADLKSLAMSWIFVFLRFAHSIVHVTSNKLMWRMRFYFASTIVLMLMWGRLLFQLLGE